MELRLMTFNLRRAVLFDLHNAWPFRRDRVAQAIERAGAWVVATQEGLSGMLKELDHRMPHLGRIGDGRKGGERSEHCAIYYHQEHLAVTAWGQFWLSTRPQEPGSKSWGAACPRICTWAQFQFKSNMDQEFLLFNTHLDHWSQRAREEGIKLITGYMAELKAKTGLPALLLGDMNATPKSKVIRFLRDIPGLTDGFIATGQKEHEVGATYHGFTGRHRGLPIDYLFGTEEVGFRKVWVDRTRIDGKYPSDHYPVLADIALAR